MWEVLTGVLGGLAYGANVGGLEDLSRPQEVSHFLLALDPAAYLPLELFTARIDSLIEQIRQRAAGARGGAAVRAGRAGVHAGGGPGAGRDSAVGAAAG